MTGKNRRNKKLDPDWLALKRCVEALESQSDRMKRATLDYLWDRYVVHPRLAR
jgi:hypothetical protein